MKLPPSLVPWRVQLERFPEEIALGLAPLVQRLAAAVGPLASAYLGSEQPDGFDGVSPRGEYQRLLASEWLLADEEPDEFLRRAAMREHLFLRLAERDPKGCKRSIALFDAGPSQLGSPRLAHLAMLAVLERRALAAGAEFEFGVLQRPEPARRAADVLHLLHSRSPLEASAAQIASWLELLQPIAAEDEIWWVGGPRLEQLLAGHRGPRMLVRDPLRAENDRLDVELHVRERRQQVVLQLPDPRLRARLIRNPFEEVVLHKLPTTLAAHQFWFSADGRRLLVNQGGGIHAYVTVGGAVGPARESSTGFAHVFNPPNPSMPRILALLAVTWHRRHFVAVMRCTGQMLMMIGSEEFPIEFERKPARPWNDRLWQLLVQGKHALHALLVDSKGTLFRGARQRDGSFRFRPILDSVVLLDQRQGHYFYAAHADGRLSVGEISDQFGIRAQRSVAAVSDPVVFSVCHPTTRLGAFAVQVPGE